jgi:DinB family protein
MNANFASSRGPSDPCCGGTDVGNERETYRSSLEFHRATRVQTLAMVQGLSQAQMDFAPAPGKWSVGEVLDHLVLGQRLNLSYIAEVIGMKRTGQRAVRRLSFTDVDVSIGYIPKSLLPALEAPFTVLNLFLPSSVRDFMTSHRLVPAQNPGITTPRRARPADELRNDLISSLKEMNTLLESHSHFNYCEMVIQHPLLGKNDVPGLLRFLALHEQRHQSQIRGIMTSAQFPKSNLEAGETGHVR